MLQRLLGHIVWPVQYTVDMPFHLVEQSHVFFQERIDLLAENAKLRQQHIYLQAQVQKLTALEAENHELRELLRSVGKDKESFFEARIIHADIEPFSHQIMLNKGSVDGSQVGQPVIDAHGLVGVVLATNPHTARVLLLTDAGFAVPVQSVRSGERAIATGSGTGGELRLNYVPRTADFIEGDQLVTSGLGGRFPVGYPVGTITSIQHDPSTRFTLIGITPSAKLGQLRHVLLMKHNNVIMRELTQAKSKNEQQAQPTPNDKAQDSNHVQAQMTTHIQTELTQAINEIEMKQDVEDEEQDGTEG